MNLDDAKQAAHRAANAVMMLPRQQSWLCVGLGWPPECRDKLLEHAAFFVRVREFSVAEALYLELRSEKAKDWAECAPIVRAAFEVFAGTLKACDKLVTAEAKPIGGGVGWMTDGDEDMAPDFGERI